MLTLPALRLLDIRLYESHGDRGHGILFAEFFRRCRCPLRQIPLSYSFRSIVPCIGRGSVFAKDDARQLQYQLVRYECEGAGKLAWSLAAFTPVTIVSSSSSPPEVNLEIETNTVLYHYE